MSQAADSSPSTQLPARQYYERTIQTRESESGEFEATKNKVSRSRILVVVLWVALFFLALNGWISLSVAWLLAILGFVGLICLAGWEQKLANRISLASERAKIAATQIARIDRNWKEVPEIEATIPEANRQTSMDLDLFGHASLYQFVCRAHTPGGRELLRDWICLGSSPDVVKQRNLAATKLAPMRDYRENLDLRGRLLGASAKGPTAFMAWAEGDRWLDKKPWLIPLSRALVAVAIGAFALAAMGFMTTPMLLVVMGVFLINLILSVLWAGQVHEIFEMVDSRQNDVVHYRELLNQFAELPTEPELLNQLRQRMGDDTSLPQRAFEKLGRIMQFARMRHSGLLGIVHLLLQLGVLIDFHVLGFLERWHREYGANVRDWFDAVGELEALASLASIHHDYPEWVFPDYALTNSKFESTQLGHPLLPNAVCNDVTLGPAGTFLLVTGSNMSGKSTLLRTIGLNCVLAQAGAPVCATALKLAPVEIETSMRIQDSLEDGISFFMAELQRLKEVVDRASELEAEKERTLLFLLDEILQGTNSAERHIAVTRVVQQLVESMAMGAISTHDLELGSNDELATISTPVHFRETISDAEGMTFDYTMRQGVATTTNALKLLELVGIKQ